MKTSTPPKQSRRLSREKFLSRALEVLSREGEAQLRIDALVDALGVTKGSFYWHFANRADFVRSLSEYWQQWSTDYVVEEMGDLEGDPKELLMKLDEIVVRDDLTRFDLVMRSWATHEPEVARIVEEVDSTRLDFVRRLFRQLGYRGRDLDTRTRLFVISTSFWSSIYRNEDRDLRLKRLQAVLDILTQRKAP
jgi:AcrR family transcriptional regulator